MILSLTIALLALQTPSGSGQSLGLRAALARAVATRGRVTEVRALMAEARAGVRVAGAIPNPEGSVSFTDDTPRRHVSVIQPFDWLLRRGPDRAAARAGLRRAEADSTLALRELEAEVRTAYFGARGSQEGLRFARETAALADSLTMIADTRLRTGDISQFERDQVALEAARVHQQLSVAEQAHGLAGAALTQAIAWGDSALPLLSDPMDAGLDTPPDSLAPPTDDLPSVRAARADSAASRQQLRSIKLGRLPIPALGAGAEWDDPTNPNLGTLSVLTLTFPIALWHHAGGQVAEAGARADAGAARVSEARAAAERALREARLILRQTAGRARTSRDTLLPIARRLREQAVKAWRAGETGLLPVLDAMRSEREIGRGLVDDLLAFQQAVAAWKALVGDVP